MTGTEQHTGSGGGGMDEDRRLTITWTYERTWQRMRYRQAVENITECTALTVRQQKQTFSGVRGNRIFLIGEQNARRLGSDTLKLSLRLRSARLSRHYD
jgi:hypothetical protein